VDPVFKIEQFEEEFTEVNELEPSPRLWDRKYESLELTSDDLKTQQPSIEKPPPRTQVASSLFEVCVLGGE
jgi:hypothetical protein